MESSSDLILESKSLDRLYKKWLEDKNKNMKTSLTKKEQAYLKIRDAFSFKFPGDGTYRILSVKEVLNESIHTKNETLDNFINFWTQINSGSLEATHYPNFTHTKEPAWK